MRELIARLPIGGRTSVIARAFSGSMNVRGIQQTFALIIQKQAWHSSMKQGPTYAALTLRGPRNLVPVKGE